MPKATTIGGRDEEAVRRFVEHLALTFSDWGFPRMPARVLITMMSADEQALTAAELAERLEVSPAAISGAVRYLIQIGILAREPDPGSRRDRYRLPSDAWYELSTAKAGFFPRVAELAASGTVALGGAGTPAGARVAEMREYFLFIQAELDGLLARWQRARAQAKRPGRATGGGRAGRARAPR